MVDRFLPARLPAEYSSFVGRRQELSQVVQSLSSARLLTLTGLGGVGKSRLALSAAAKARHAFPDGMCVVDVARLSGPTLLVEAVANALGIVDRAARENADVLAGTLADRRVLVIIDNCDYMLEACAILVDELLGATRGLRVLATSREAIHIADERVCPVSPLQVPDEPAGLSAESGLRYSGVALFADRAAAVQPGFALTDDNVDLVAGICRKLDGIPLAIELAAARLSTLSLAEIADRVPNRFRLLSSGNRAAPRHRSLRRVLDWSFALCTKPERSLWQRLSVFASVVTAEAAEQVCGGDGLAAHEVSTHLAGLAAKSVLMTEEGGYRLLDTVSQYGLEQLRSPDQAGLDEAMLRQRHREYYLSMAERFDADWFGPRQVEWLRRMRAEQANLRAALTSGLDLLDDEQSGLRMAAALHRFWWANGGLEEGRNWLGRALSADHRPGRGRMRALSAHGRLLTMIGCNAAAVEPVGECLRQAVRLGDVDCEADSRSLLGFSLALGYDVAAGLPLLAQAARVRGVTPATRALVLTRLGVGMLLRGELTRADRLLFEARRMCRAHGDEWLQALTLDVSAMVALARGDTAQGRSDARGALRVRRALTDAWGEATTLEVLAWISAAEHDHRTAARLLGAAGRHWSAVGGSPFAGAWSQRHDECENSARTVLGATEFDVEFRRGRAFTRDEAVAVGLGEPPPVDGQARLTPRQTEIVALVAEGLSYKQIAGRLTLSSRTVESHVSRILSTLDLSSRAEIAIWHAEHERPT